MVVKAWAISDRSGFKFPRNEMVVEPGTGLLVHRSETDGRYSLVNHPANNKQRYIRTGDPRPVNNPRPDIDYQIDLFLRDENDEYILDNVGDEIFTPIGRVL